MNLMQWMWYMDGNHPMLWMLIQVVVFFMLVKLAMTIEDYFKLKKENERLRDSAARKGQVKCLIENN